MEFNARWSQQSAEDEDDSILYVCESIQRRHGIVDRKPTY